MRSIFTGLSFGPCQGFADFESGRMILPRRNPVSTEKKRGPDGKPFQMKSCASMGERHVIDRTDSRAHPTWGYWAPSKVGVDFQTTPGMEFNQQEGETPTIWQVNNPSITTTPPHSPQSRNNTFGLQLERSVRKTLRRKELGKMEAPETMMTSMNRTPCRGLHEP